MKNSQVDKWKPIILHRFGIKNDGMIQLMCEYCEWYSTRDHLGSDLPVKMDNIFTKINSHQRIDIVGKSYNTLTGNIEYKLSNGNYIPLDGDVKSLPNLEDMVDIFGIDFIKDQYPQLLRDKRIDKIVSD